MYLAILKYNLLLFQPILNTILKFFNIFYNLFFFGYVLIVKNNYMEVGVKNMQKCILSIMILLSISMLVGCANTSLPQNEKSSKYTTTSSDYSMTSSDYKNKE